MAASTQKLPHCRQMEQLETDLDSLVEHPGKESDSGGAGLETRLHCQEFQQEPDLGYPRDWQHHPWEESRLWVHPMEKQHSRQH